jgi:hypothetical protein
MPRGTVILALASSLLLTACPKDRKCAPPGARTLSVPLKAQRTSMWCWAASGQMTMNYIHPASGVSQADEANKRFGRTDCGNSPTPSQCIKGGWPEYDKYKFSSTRTSNTALTWAKLKAEIGCARRPFAFSWHWPDGGGHMMVLIGYKQIRGIRYVLVNNPWPPTPKAGAQTWMTYNRYVEAAGHHTHWDDFYQIRYTG